MTGAVGGDYNLGRAHGDIVITADTHGAQEAQAAMAATSAEAEVLDRRMGIVNQRFEENRRTSVQTAEQIMRQRRQLEDLRITHQRYADEYEKAQARLTRAEREYRQEYEKTEQDQRRLNDLHKEMERAKAQEERLLLRVTDAHTRYERKLNDVNIALTTFNRHHIEATTGLNRMALEADKLGSALERVSDKLGSVLRIVGQGGIMGLFGLGSTSTMAAMGAGGLGQITSTIGGVVLAMQQLSGVAALIPAVVGGAVVSIGTLATAFHGVSQAMGSMNDPVKFLESIRELAPAAREAMITFYSFQDAIRGVRFAIQQATFEPFIQQLQPLIMTWLPLLQNAGIQVGRTFGQMISQVMAFMQTGSAQQGFSTFIDNMTKGLQAASHAIQPFMSAMQTLSIVGSSFFERIGTAITTVANEFNSWVQTAANSGRLQAWIDAALTGFTNLARVVMNVSEALINISSLASRHGDFLGWLREVSERFKTWTESADGIQRMANFFDLLHQAGQAVEPILKLMGQGLEIVAGAFTRLGIEIAPAVTQFFQDIVEAIHSLAPILLQMGPSISAFLVEFGNALNQLVQQAGPQLPGIFQAFTQALLLLLPVVTTVLREIINFVSHFTPKQLEVMILAAGAVRGLAAGFGLLSGVLAAGPWAIAAIAIAAIGVALYEAYQHSEGFRNAVNGLVNFLQSIPGEIASAWDSLGSVLSNTVDKWVASAVSWGSRLAHAFADGIKSGIDFVSDAWGAIQGKTKDNTPQSRAKEGPWSNISPEEAGAKLSTDYARGMASGIPAVSSASSGIAASTSGPGGLAAGTTGMGFSSAGASGRSGSSSVGGFGSDIGVGRGIGGSGFDKYIDFLTSDLSAWSSILQGGFDLVKNTVTNAIIPGVKLLADFWNAGDNPLTRPGGIFGPQQLWGQQDIPGIESVQPHGQAPDDWARKANAQRVNPQQQQVPGVTNVGPRGIPRPGDQGFVGPVAPGTKPPPGPGSAGGPAPAAPPAAAAAQPAGLAPGGGTAPAGGASGPGGYTADQLAQSIISQGRAAGMNDQQIQATLAVGLQETGLGTNPRTNVVQNQNGTPGITGPFQQDTGYAKYGNRQDPDVAARGFIDQFVHTGQGLANPNPWDQALQVQRPARVGAGGYDDRGGPDSGSYLRQQQGGAAASILQRLGGVGTPGGPGPIDGTGFAQELLRRRNAPPGAPGGGIGLPQVAGQYPNGPGGNVGVASLQGAGFPPLFQNPAGGGNPTIPQWVQNFVKQYGGPSLVAGSTPHGSLHGNSGGAGYAVDVTGDPAEMDKLAKFLEEHPEASAMMIHQDVSGEPRGVLAGRTVAKGSTFTTPGGTYADESTMVHWAPSGGGNAPPAINPPPVGGPANPASSNTGGSEGVPQLPAGPGTGGGLWSDIPTGSRVLGGIGLGVGGLTAGYWAGSRISQAIGRPLLSYRQARFNQFDAQAQLDAIRGLNPEDRAAVNAMRNPRITFGEPGTGITGLNVNLGAGPQTGESAPNSARPISFADLTPEEQLQVARDLQRFRGTGVPGGAIEGGPRRIPTFAEQYPRQFDIGRQMAESAYRVPAPFGERFLDSRLGNFAGGATIPLQVRQALDIATGGEMPRQTIPFTNTTVLPAASVPQNMRPLTSATAGTILGSAGLVAASGVSGLGAGALLAGSLPITAGLYGLSTFGAGTGDPAARRSNAELDATPYDVTGQGPAGPMRGQVGRAQPPAPRDPTGGILSGTIGGPQRTQPTAPPVPGVTAASPFAGQTARVGIGAGIGAGIQQGTATSQPVHVTNAESLPGGRDSSGWGRSGVALRDQTTPTPPRPGQSGVQGPVPVNTTPPAQVQGQPPANAQPNRASQIAQAGLPGGQPSINYNDVYNPNNLPQQLPFNAQSPGEAFMSGLASAGNIASDAFQVFNDVIKNISDTAAITDMLVRGPSNTEDIVGIIKHFQSFLTTAADISKTIGDVGGLVGGASGGMDFGAGGGIQAVAGIVSAGIEAVNQSITLGIDIYHQIGKYAGFIIGEFLGGPNTGPLGGNVRMLLNTRTNQLQTYSEDNPLNKNTFNVPLWQRSYATQPTPPPVQIQQNLYVGPGQTPQQNMSDQMWAATTGGGATSVAAHS